MKEILPLSEKARGVEREEIREDGSLRSAGMHTGLGSVAAPVRSRATAPTWPRFANTFDFLEFTVHSVSLTV